MSYSTHEKTVAVIILNYRNCEDTIECVRSVLHSNYPNFSIAVCDNNSQDNSFERLNTAFLSEPRVTVLATGRNGGYAYGNNFGLSWAIRSTDAIYYWILNNDTSVDPEAMRSLVKKAEHDSEYGVIGAKLVEFDSLDTVQAHGGSVLDKWTCISRHLTEVTSISAGEIEREVECQISFVSGASMFVTKRFIDIVGFLAEDYFLYYEEADWVERSAGRFRLGYCSEAVVRHKEGASIGSSSGPKRASPFSVYYICRSRLMFAWRHRRAAVPTVYLRMVRYWLSSALRRENQIQKAILCALLRRPYLV